MINTDRSWGHGGGVIRDQRVCVCFKVMQLEIFRLDWRKVLLVVRPSHCLRTSVYSDGISCNCQQTRTVGMETTDNVYNLSFNFKSRA